ncbi:MAG: glucose-6-phosphate 1-dehydrogenase, partial [Gaiellaceae bacterium]|nr:glucose-6-phosphate 1-dehydrogenase [Gaiellaceae bacterium]
MSQRAADAFIAFGITGNLAKEMTFKSLYRLESRGVLNCPIIGVAADDWTLTQLRRHMRESIKQGIGKVDRATFDRLAARLSYVQGDFADPATYERLAKALAKARAPVFYLETPPSLFATVVGGLATAGLA